MLKFFMPSSFGLIVILFFLIQYLRDPDVPADYVSTFYVNQTQKWEDNGYIALQGLAAPAGEKDFYRYGQEKVLAVFIRNQRLKKELDVAIPPSYPLPAMTVDAAPVSTEFETTKPVIDEGKKTALPCRYLWPEEQAENKDCLSAAQLSSHIRQHKILWQRFNTLPDYKAFSVVPIGIETFYALEDLIALGQWKNTKILDMAAEGDAEKAFAEWRRFMVFYRTLVSSADTGGAKAVYMVMENRHRQIYAKLLYHHPELAAYIEDIEKDFPAQGINLYRGRTLFSDDWAQVEESFLNSYAENAEEHGKHILKGMLSSGAFRTKIYMCQKDNAAYLESRTAFSFSGKDYMEICRKYFPDGPEAIMLESFLMAGNPISNAIHMLLMGGVLKGGELIENMYRGDLEWRMAMVGAQIIKDKIAGEQIPAAIAQVEGFDSRLPLQWDGEKNRLFFKDMDGTERSFPLPVHQ